MDGSNKKCTCEILIMLYSWFWLKTALICKSGFLYQIGINTLVTFFKSV